MGDFFICPRCGNKDPKFIGYRNDQPYCRRCISFIGKHVDDKPKQPADGGYSLAYNLSFEQEKLSNKLLDNFVHNINSFVYAVCGSGKTEIIFKVIAFCIDNGLKVGYTVPRRDVVVEIYYRFKNVFTNCKVIYLCGDHTQQLYGDLICLTTHQLFRYENYFDLLICDEVDAFPFKHDFVLNSLFFKAIKGNYILLSATPTEEDISSFKKTGGDVLTLFSRFHGYPLPVPEIILDRTPLIYVKLIKYLREYLKVNKKVFVFTPTISQCEEVFDKVRYFCKGGTFVHSKCEDRSEKIEDFRNGKYSFLITTSVLERGVTVKDLQVIVFNADHKIYDSYSLVQIAGRVGRKKEAPEGKVIYLAKEESYDMVKSIRTIRESNANLQDLFQADKGE